ncbi:MAG: T9SS type A sorting domain-containing protein, partial [Bacteroidales bacterium]|nr:T9SS type A sorting domain-containing protein [Bacteroidales bacterium]
TLSIVIVLIINKVSNNNVNNKILFDHPSDWMAYQRAYPYWGINVKNYVEEMKKAISLHRSSDTKAQWQLLGPTNIGGRITDIEVHPNNPNLIYVAAATGGIFKTTDNGQSWQNIFQNMPFISIGDIAIDSNNPNILYAGTGEANASSFSFLGGGVFKSVDGGQNWSFCGLPHSAYIGRIIVDKFNSQNIYVAACGNLFSPSTERGIYKSTNGGQTWQKILFVTDSTSAIDIVQHPQNGQILYAAMWERIRGRNYRRSKGWSSGIYKTTDGGNNWVKLTNGLPNEEMGRIGLAIAPSNPQVLYAFIDMVPEARVYKSIDGGNSWTRCLDSDLADVNSNFGWYFGQIRVDPNNENRIYVMGVDLYRSDDGGNSWIQLAGYYNMDMIHVDHHAMTFIGNTILNGNDGGLYVSNDLGENWEKINNLPITQFYDIEIDYIYPERIYGGTQDNFSIGTVTGNVDDWIAFLGGDGFYTVVDYTNSNVIYMEYQWGNLHKTTDWGFNMYDISTYWENDRTNWSSPYVIHPTNPQILYFGTYRLWKTEDAGETWFPISNDLTLGNDGSSWHTISTIAISSINPNILVIGTDDGKVHVSTDGGLSYQDRSNGLPNRWITRVVCDPNQSNRIYATVSGFRWDEPYPHVFRSDNLGITWTPVSGNLPNIPVNTMVVDPLNGNLFVGTDAGVFFSSNGGQTWSGVSGNIGNVPVVSMKIHAPTRKLVVGTYGLSAWGIDLGTFTNENINAYSSDIVKIFPNPINQNSTCTIQYITGKWSVWKVAIYDTNGKICKELNAMFTDVIQWTPSDNNNQPLKPGVYYVHVQDKNNKYVSKIIISN